MKTMLLPIVLFLIVFTSCFPKKDKTSDLDSKALDKQLDGADVNDIRFVDYTDVDGYFFASKVDSLTVFMLNKADFERYFHPARTMTNRSTEIDFDMQRVGAIVLPETKNNVSILLDSVYAIGNRLNIVYSIKQEPDERSSTIIPYRSLVFDASLDVDSVTFRNGNRKEQLSVR